MYDILDDALSRLVYAPAGRASLNHLPP